jgi:polyphosphate kinase 2 (PPK2 family)
MKNAKYKRLKKVYHTFEEYLVDLGIMIQDGWIQVETRKQLTKDEYERMLKGERIVSYKKPI